MGNDKRPRTITDEDYDLSREERQKVSLTVELVVKILTDRYGIEPAEAVDAIKWVMEHRQYLARLRQAFMIAIISVLVSAGALAFYQGVSDYISAHRHGQIPNIDGSR